MTRAAETGMAEATALIRKAWQAGKKEVTIDGVRMKLRRDDHKVNVRIDDKTVQKTETWLVATPAQDGRFAPVYNVELKPGTNTRTTK